MSRERLAAGLAALRGWPSVALATYPTPVEELSRLREALGASPRLLVKRDDAISFGFGGNKVRKLELVAAEARAAGADCLVTVGGVQSNHARVTAAVAARLGLRCILVLNGEPPERLSGNMLLSTLAGAEIIHVDSRADREPAMREAADRDRRQGGSPFEIPLGASTPVGALGYARAFDELLRQIPAPDAVIVSTSSGGTQSGLLAGRALLGASTRIIGISADESAATMRGIVSETLAGIAGLLWTDASDPAAVNLLEAPIEVDDGFVGEGYGIPTAASREAIAIAARTEALFLDPTYTAKAMAALMAYVREGRFRADETVLLWHTGGQVALFA